MEHTLAQDDNLISTPLRKKVKEKVTKSRKERNER